MRYSIVTNNLDAVESPSDKQVELIENILKSGTSEWHQQQVYFSYLRERNYWILCKCNGRALIHVKSGPNYYYLFSRNSEKRVEHQRECQFRAIASTNSKEKGDIKTITGTDYDFFIEKSSEHSLSNKRENPSRGIRSRQSKLFKLIRHVMRNAENHHIINGCLNGYQTEKDKFLMAAKEIKLGGIHLHEVTFFQQSRASLKYVRDKLFNTKFKQGHHKTAFLIWIADSYELNNNTLSFNYNKDKSMSLNECRALLHHARGDREDGPFFIAALYKYGKNKDGKMCFSFPSAYVVPILSKHSWMICDSNYEREMAYALSSFAKIEFKNIGITSVIEKPIEPLKDIGENNIIPDFDIRVGDKRKFIEVMGYRTLDYIERKERVVPLMERVAPVDEFIAHRFSNKEERQKTMFKYAVKIFKELS
ncbi:hypothetical protein [Thalassotalea marina]|uniref:DUF1173 family protein n=1 Tax=Thalassotalea marina TaxID=1673741 RepID=A0A919BT29_9GAMM|nr:hypothetical protein [Thalassotalea marina]GHG07954.1 hypothetical protein GCM10017161_42180 [Thalassotalea marina]